MLSGDTASLKAALHTDRLSCSPLRDDEPVAVGPPTERHAVDVNQNLTWLAIESRRERLRRFLAPFVPPVVLVA